MHSQDSITSQLNCKPKQSPSHQTRKGLTNTKAIVCTDTSPPHSISLYIAVSCNHILLSVRGSHMIKPFRNSLQSQNDPTPVKPGDNMFMISLEENKVTGMMPCLVCLGLANSILQLSKAVFDQDSLLQEWSGKSPCPFGPPLNMGNFIGFGKVFGLRNHTVLLEKLCPDATKFQKKWLSIPVPKSFTRGNASGPLFLIFVLCI